MNDKKFGYIYAMTNKTWKQEQEQEHIICKIGFTYNLRKRIQTANTFNFIPHSYICVYKIKNFTCKLVPNLKKLEQVIHNSRKIRDRRISSGEFFRFIDKHECISLLSEEVKKWSTYYCDTSITLVFSYHMFKVKKNRKLLKKIKDRQQKEKIYSLIDELVKASETRLKPVKQDEKFKIKSFKQIMMEKN